jgi:hypothetical protein
MANNQKKLKAFVRYDGSGRVVASSLILRKNKPRVGRWFEIPTYECCNDTTTSTTTTIAPSTTTSTTTIGVPFSGTINYGDSGANACSESPSYGSFSVTGNGATFCSSTQLTAIDFAFTPLGTNYVSFGGQYYSILSNGATTVTVTSSCSPCA